MKGLKRKSLVHRDRAINTSPRRPPSPPPLQLLTDSQEDLNTSLHQVFTKDDSFRPPSPHQNGNKRRRIERGTVLTTFNAVSEGPIVVNSDSVTPDLHLPIASPRQDSNSFSLPFDRSYRNNPVSSSNPGDHSLQVNSQSISQHNLSQMSHDTLSLLPRIVRTHFLGRPPRSPVPHSADLARADAIGATSDNFSGNFSGNFNTTQSRRPSPTSSGVAKACFIATLSRLVPLNNPFLTDRDKHVFPQVSHHGNASESFQSMDHLLTPRDDANAANSTDPVMDFSGLPAIENQQPFMGIISSLHLLEHHKQLNQENTLKRIVASLGQLPRSLEFYTLGPAGRGAFSEVLQCVHRVDGCTYAIKKNITPIIGDKKRLEALNEVFTLSALQGHLNILRYCDAWIEDRGKFIYMQTEYLSQGNLQALYVDQKKPMPLPELLAFAEDVSSALEFIHSKDIAHVDIKPDNIFRANRGLDRPSFVVGDFGLACNKYGLGASRTEGDSRYICPEVFLSSIQEKPCFSDEAGMLFDDGACVRFNGSSSSHYDVKRNVSDGEGRDLCVGDVFSFGATLYELAIGTPLPKSGIALERLRDNLDEVVSEAREKCQSQFIADIIRKCLEPNPSLRTSAGDVKRMCLLRHRNEEIVGTEASGNEAAKNNEMSAEITRLRTELKEEKNKFTRFQTATFSLLSKVEKGRRQYRSRPSRQPRQRPRMH